MSCWRPFVLTAVLLASLPVPSAVSAQAERPDAATPPGEAQTAPVPTTTLTVVVVGTTPLAGLELPIAQIPAPVQTVTAPRLDASGALSIADYLGRRLHGVSVNQAQGNVFQPDVRYRGYTASPLLGTPQGLSVFMDGVRLNQPFGDVVSWDLIPHVAISSSALMPGSNPAFGLNTLGGALSIQTKDGRESAGTSLLATYGSDLRRDLEFEHGGSRPARGIDWYLAGRLFAEDGWRTESPSDVRQLFGKVGWSRTGLDLHLSLAHADNSLSGNGLQEVGFLQRDYRSAYTRPDVTDNRSTLLNVTVRRNAGPRLTLSGNTYYRHIRTGTLNGDINEESLGESLFAPGAPDRDFPFAFCRNQTESLSPDGTRCSGLLNRTDTLQRSGGAAAQLTFRDATSSLGHQLTTGAAFDRSAVGFHQSSELGYLDVHRRVTGTGLFDEDSYVDLRGTVGSLGLFAADTVTVADAWHLTISGRFNRTTVRNRDRLLPGGGAGSLDGTHTFSRFNPAAGMTYDLRPNVNVYLGYSEGSRAATSIELGCADPDTPCRLPNAMAGDPPLDQVVTNTWESGVRGAHGRLDWHIGGFRADNHDDILFVASERTGFGYFRNVGTTRRQGVELGMEGRVGPLAVGAGYTFLDATYRSQETVNGASNSSNETARAGQPGLPGTIEIQSGDRLPLVPRHMLKLFGTLAVTSTFAIEADMTTVSESYAMGNENNLHTADGTYYLGPGTAEGFTVVNLGAHYRLTRWLRLVGQVDNLLDRRYATAAELGLMGFSAPGAFDARPLPPVDGAYPLRHATFVAPGAPRRAWLGTRISF